MTGACASLFLVFRDNIGAPFFSHPIAVQERTTPDNLVSFQPLCAHVQNIQLRPQTSICRAAAQQAAIRAVEQQETTTKSLPLLDCPAARRALLAEVATTSHNNLWVVAVAGLLHPADVFTIDLLTSNLNIAEPQALQLAAAVNSPKKNTETIVRELTAAAALCVARVLDARPDPAVTAPVENTDALRDELALREQLRILEEQAERRKLQTAGLVHDMRTPLSAILGHIDLFNMGVYGNISSEQREALSTMRDRASRLLALIKDILDHSRLEGGLMPLVPSSYPVSTIVNRALSQVETAANNKGIATSINFLDNTDSMVVYGSEQRTEQVLINLLSNAVKYTDEGAITVTVQLADALHFKVTVSDTGNGIPASDLEMIFEPYQRSRNGPRRTGVGLGLAICRAFVEQMGGTLTVESTFGTGSHFYVKLPMKAKHDEKKARH